MSKVTTEMVRTGRGMQWCKNFLLAKEIAENKDDLKRDLRIQVAGCETLDDIKLVLHDITEELL